MQLYTLHDMVDIGYDNMWQVICKWHTSDITRPKDFIPVPHPVPQTSLDLSLRVVFTLFWKVKHLWKRRCCWGLVKLGNKISSKNTAEVYQFDWGTAVANRTTSMFVPGTVHDVVFASGSAFLGNKTYKQFAGRFQPIEVGVSTKKIKSTSQDMISQKGSYIFNFCFCEETAEAGGRWKLLHLQERHWISSTKVPRERSDMLHSMLSVQGPQGFQIK